MTESSVNANELLNSYRLLFNPYASVSIGIFNNLYIQQVKSAYRQKVKMTHPDKSTQLGIQENILTKEFKEITKAYEILLFYIEREKNRNEFNPPLSPERSSTEALHSSHINESVISPEPPTSRPIEPSRIQGDFYYRGLIPGIRLRFGRFLYYRGLISWKMLVDSINWQKKRRPLIGQLCIKQNYLTSQDVAMVLYYNRNGVPFGQVAKNLGILTDEQIQEILKKQTPYKSKLGNLFIEKNIFSKDQINQFIQELKNHNSRFQCFNTNLSYAL